MISMNLTRHSFTLAVAITAVSTLLFGVSCVSNDPDPAVSLADVPLAERSSWSLGSYPGWVQNQMPPNEVPYEYFSHILHFAMYPNSRGGLDIGDIFTERNANRAVAAAHAANTPIILVVGGEGEGDKFVGATSDENLPVFVENIVQRMTKHGYDGVSIDWEESVVDDQLISLILQLSRELEVMTPRPLLMIDVMTNFVSADVATAVTPYVDAVNIMSYYNFNTIEREHRYYSNAGVPNEKIIMGIGLFPGADDQKRNRLQEKMRYGRDQGFLGNELWSFEFVDFDGEFFQRYEAMRW